MKNNVKLMGIATSATLSVALLAGCPGTELPPGVGPTTGKPQITGRVTKNNNPVSGRTVFLKSFSGGSEGSFVGGSAVADKSVKTDSNGSFTIEVPADAVEAGGLFGVGYDISKEDAKKIAVTDNPDEIQWFTSPAINLKTKTGKSATINFDLAWNATAFSPANGAAVPAGKVTFTLAEKMDATEYEVTVNSGTVAGSGAKAFSGKSATKTIEWADAKAGDYVYQAKAFTPTGISGITSNQQASSWLTFKVTGAQ